LLDCHPHQYRKRLDRLCDLGFPVEITAKALRQADGNEELAANLLLNEAATKKEKQEDVQKQLAALRHFCWGNHFHDLAKVFPDFQHVQHYCRFMDFFTAKICLRLRTESCFWAHIAPFHYNACALHRFRQLFCFQKIPHRCPVPPLETRYEFFDDARLSICRNAMGEKIALAMCRLSMRSRSDHSSQAVKHKVLAEMIMRRVSCTSCLQIQSSAEAFSCSRPMPLLEDARQACRRSDKASAGILLRLSPELLACNSGWDLLVSRDIENNEASWRTFSYLRNATYDVQ
jgi:hypothetical protein